MKIDLSKILLFISVLYIGWFSFIKDTEDVTEPDPIEVVIPETSGKTEIVYLEPEVVRDTVWIKGDTVEVDKGYKELYEKAKDSLEQAELYLLAIKIRDYKGVIVDNEDILIEGTATTRGELLDYSLDYTIKEKRVSYIPEVVSKLPKLSGKIGVEVGVPTVPNTPFLVKANVGLMNDKGHEVNLSYDTQQRVWAGYNKTFKIFK